MLADQAMPVLGPTSLLRCEWARVGDSNTVVNGGDGSTIIYRGAGLLVHSCGRTPGTPTPGLGPNMEGRAGAHAQMAWGRAILGGSCPPSRRSLGACKVGGHCCGASSGRGLPPSFRDASSDFQTAVPASPSGPRPSAGLSLSEERCSLMTFPRAPLRSLRCGTRSTSPSKDLQPRRQGLLKSEKKQKLPGAAAKVWTRSSTPSTLVFPLKLGFLSISVDFTGEGLCTHSTLSRKRPAGYWNIQPPL